MYIYTVCAQNYYPVYFSLRCLELICKRFCIIAFGHMYDWMRAGEPTKTMQERENGEYGKGNRNDGGCIFRKILAPQIVFHAIYALTRFVWHGIVLLLTHKHFMPMLTSSHSYIISFSRSLFLPDILFYFLFLFFSSDTWIHSTDVIKFLWTKIGREHTYSMCLVFTYLISFKPFM